MNSCSADCWRPRWWACCARSWAATWCCAAWPFWAMRWRTRFCPAWRLPICLNGNLLIGALVAAVVVAMLIGFLSRQGTIKEDTAIGILFAAALSLGVLLISTIRTYAVDLTHILFGNVLGVSTSGSDHHGGAGRVRAGLHRRVLPRISGDFVRSDPGGDAAHARRTLPHFDAHPAGADDRRVTANRGRGSGVRDVGDARRGRLSADAPPRRR